MNMEKMKAIIVTRYGGPEVLQIKEVNIPSPKENELLIQVYAAAVNNTDPVFRKGKPYISRIFTGLLKPKHSIPGDVLAGKVVNLGNKVTNYSIGDRVFGYSTDKLGAQAEFICLSETSPIALIPENIGYSEAAAIVDGGHTALAFLNDKVKISKKTKVLIFGASGSIGTAAVQLAKNFGADVTAVCSESNIDLLESLGIEKIIDYKKVDFTKEAIKYDIIFDTVAKKTYSQCKKVLSDDGIYLTTFPTLFILLKGLFQSKNKEKKAFFVAAGLKKSNQKIDNLNYLSNLMVNQKMKAVISKRYSMAETAEAHKYVETGHKRGNIIINIVE
jgi:NADPH:quinone reductase-like Zn-dependent oxidoreductase